MTTVGEMDLSFKSHRSFRSVHLHTSGVYVILSFDHPLPPVTKSPLLYGVEYRVSYFFVHWVCRFCLFLRGDKVSLVV